MAVAGHRRHMGLRPAASRRRASTPTTPGGMLALAVPLAIVGARLFHVLDNFSFYWHNPGDIVTKQLVGLAIYGVITGGVSRRGHLLPLEEAAHLACARRPGPGDPRRPAHRPLRQHHQRRHLGDRHHLPWGLVYTNPHAFLPANLLGVPTQPTPVYEQLWLLVVIGIVWWALPRLKTDGLAFLLYLALYCLRALLPQLPAREQHPLPGSARGTAHRRRCVHRGVPGGLVAAPAPAGSRAPFGRGDRAREVVPATPTLCSVGGDAGADGR